MDITNLTPLAAYSRKLRYMTDSELYRARSILFRLCNANRPYSPQFSRSVANRLIITNAHLMDRNLPIPI